MTKPPEKPRSIFKDPSRIEINNTKGSPEAAKINAYTKEKLSQEESQLTWSSLNALSGTKFETNRSEALGFSLKFLKESEIPWNLWIEKRDLEEPINIVNVKKCIFKYQELSNIWTDGKVWKETFIEMKAEEILYSIPESYSSISVSKLNEIKNVLSYVTLWSANYTLLTALIFDINYYLDDGDSRKLVVSKIIKSNNLRLNSPEWKKYVTKCSKSIKKNDTDIASIYSVMKNDKIPMSEKIKKLASDPTLLMAWGLLFLFGVFWSDSEFNDTFLKRLWWVAWAAILWPGIINKIWLDEMFEDAARSPLVGALKENLKVWFEKWNNWTDAFFKKEFPDLYNKFWDTIWINFWKITWGISSHNDSLASSKDQDLKKLHIEDEKLAVLVWDLLWDEKFLNTSKDDLLKITTFNVLKWYITQETQEILSNAFAKLALSDTDINNFVQYHLLKKSFKDWDVFVSDMFLTEKIRNSKDKLVINYAWDIIKWNTKINDYLSWKLKKYVRSPEWTTRQKVWIRLVSSLINWKLDEFKLSNFPSLSKSEISELEIIISELKEFLKYDKFINSEISKIESISVVTSWNFSDDSDSLATKIKELNEYIPETSKLHGLLSIVWHTKLLPLIEWYLPRIEEAKDVSRERIYKAAKYDLKIKDLIYVQSSPAWVVSNVFDVDLELKKLVKIKKAREDRKSIEDIKISEVPNIDNTPLEFKKWYDDHSDSFEELENIINKYNTKYPKIQEARNILSQNRATVIDEVWEKAEKTLKVDLKTEYNILLIAENKLKQKVLFREKYDLLKKSYTEKVSTLNKKIKDLDASSSADIKKSHEDLDLLIIEYGELLKEVFWLTFWEGYEKLKNIGSQLLTGTVFVDQAAWNSFDDIDKSLLITPVKKIVDKDALQKALTDKLSELELNYKITDLSISSIADIGLIDKSKVRPLINKIKNDHILVATSFKDIKVKSVKLKEIDTEVSNLVLRYFALIKWENDYDKLKEIKEFYDKEIKAQLWWYADDREGFWDKVLGKTNIEEASETKIRNIFESRVIISGSDIAKKTWIEEFFNDSKFSTTPQITNFKPNWSITLWQYKAYFNDFNIKKLRITTLWTDESYAVKKAKEVKTKINSFLDNKINI